jgi:hypothetical protein
MSKDLMAAASQVGGVKALCDSNTRNGTIAHIDLGQESVRGEGATVTVTFTFKNGSKLENFQAPLIMEDGAWKVALKN